MKSKRIDHIWKNGRDCIGVAVVDTGHGIKGYIGVADGLSEALDIQKIAMLGTRLRQKEVEGFFPHRIEDFNTIGWYKE